MRERRVVAFRADCGHPEVGPDKQPAIAGAKSLSHQEPPIDPTGSSISVNQPQCDDN